MLMLRVGINAPEALEDIRMGVAGVADLLRFTVGGGMITPTNPALGGSQVEGVWRL